jgi:hypothetical protein
VELPGPKTRYWLALIAPDQPGLAQAVASTETDGSFKFEGVPAGSYTLTASGPTNGYGGKAVLTEAPYFARMPVSVAANVAGIAVAVQRARTVSLVLRPGGTGCPQSAQILLVALDDFAARIDRPGTITAEKPQAIAELAPARYQVTARDLGESCFLESDTIVDLTGAGASETVAVKLAAAGAIHGKLTGADNPAQFAVALMSADPESSAPLQVVFPDAGGKFAFGGLRPGRYRLATQPAGEVSRARWVTDAARMIEMQIPAGAPTELELPAPKRSPQ